MSTNSDAEGNENSGGNVEVAEQHEWSKTPDEKCSICLEEITDVCHTDMCRHLFCYECLVRWSTIESFCPLCKTNFQSIRHSFTENGQYQVYEFPVQSNNIPASQPGGSLIEIITRGGVMYHQNMWSEPLSDSNGRYRGISSRFFRENPEQLIRLHEFIYREIFVLIELQNNETDGQLNVVRILNRGVEVVMDLIISLISVYEILGEEIAVLLQPYFGRYAIHFCHELFNFANCPYDDLVDYDRNASYFGGINDLPTSEQLVILDQIRNATRMLSYTETAVPNSDNEGNIETDTRRIVPDVIVHDSSSGDSDVELDGIMSGPIETYESPSADQPSTSTGIGYSVERPDNRSNPTTRRYTGGGTRIVDYSLSDDSTISSTSDLQTISRKRKRQVDTNSSKKTKRSTGEQQTTVERRSYSESSSSDDEDV